MAGFDAFVTLLLSFLLVAVSTPLVRKYALRWKLGDKPNGRKIHTSTIPHLGGVGMVVAVFASLLAVSFYSQGAAGIPAFLARILVPVGLIVGLGLTDDTKNLGAVQKLAIQIVAAVILAVSGFHLFVGAPVLDGNLVFVILVTAFYLVGISSSVNLVDGHDGLAAGLSLISSLSFATLAMILAAPTIVLVSLAISGACVGFLLYNFPPGKIFMGDTGSMFLGIMLGIVACSLTMQQPGVYTFFGVSFILMVPMMDSWLAIARRLTLRKPVFQADCLHIHHVLSSFGFTARQTVIVLYLVQFVLATLGVLAFKGFVFPVVIGTIIVLVLAVSFFRVMVSSKEREEAPAAKFAPGSLPSLEK